MSVVIKIENLSKQYRLGLVSTRTLSHDLNRWLQVNILGKEDPYLKIGETNFRAVKGESEYVWALKDINLEVQEGEVLGIIGKNGAGKSTILKILSKVTSPTTGTVKARGRIASLLEVGTGFHQEMTGRENIFMNGSIMGMTKAEIRKKFDEIVDFAGVERYIDTPVKRYSSGMTVRLGFAIAAYLEPEILVIDEVLAVGDAEFQKKAIAKMHDVTHEFGRTVLFVSHNMGAVQKLCGTAILLEYGKIITSGKSNEVIDYYLNQANEDASEYTFPSENKGEKLAFATKLRLEDLDGNMMSEIPIGKPWRAKIYFNVNYPVENLIIGLGMINMYETPIRTSWSNPMNFEKGCYIAAFEENNIFFAPGRYRLLIGISKGSRESIEYIDNDLWFTISDVIEGQETSVINHNSGFLINQMKMYIDKIGKK
jgi:lipopolysaccharide transport system ATP-binding protein